MATAHARPDLLATPDWLAANLSRPDLRVLDLRWRPDGTGRAIWGREHIPGAVHVDWSRELVGGADDAGVLRLAPADAVAEALARTGIGAASEVVLYDDSASLYSARTWWTLRAYGFERTRILDGGYGAWRAAGGATASDETPPRPAGDPLDLRDDRPERVRWSDVRDLLRSGTVTFIDARPGAHNRHGGDGRGLGYLSGAVKVPAAATTLPGTGRFRDPGALRALFGRVPFDRGRRVICYDGSGIAAAKLAFAVALCGHESVSVYEGGWAEWGERAQAELGSLLGR